MPNSKNTTNGASWKRRGIAAAASTAMAFTALSAAPAQASEVAEEEAAYGWYFERNDGRAEKHEIVWDVDEDIKFPPMMSMRGGGWA